MKIRTWILVFLTVLFVWLVATNISEIRQLKVTLDQARLPLVLAALLLQAGYFLVFAASYRFAFATVNIETRTLDLVPITLGSLFVNVVVPAGGAGGVALFAEHLAKRGKPAARAAAGVLLQLAADFGAFALILIPGLVYLYVEHDLKTYEIAASVILLLITGGLAGLLLLGVWRRDWLERQFSWLQRSANWVFGRLNRSLSLADDWAQKNAQEFTEAAASAAANPGRLAATVAVALAAHAFDLATLYLLFMAFNTPVGFGSLVAGYAMGVLFLIVSITPQGIGVVEGMMALVFSSLGVTGAVATAVALSYRGLTFWIPMVLGFFSLQRQRGVSANWRSLAETWGVRITAILVALMGLVNVISAVTPSLAARLVVLEQLSPLEVRHGGHLTAALAGFALLLLARSLARRKIVAWQLTMLMLGVSLASHLLKGLDYEEALLAGGLMALLAIMRSHYHARSDPPSIRQGVSVLAAAFVFTIAYGVVGFYLLDRHYSINFGFWQALRQTVVMFSQFYDPGLEPVTPFGRFFAGSIYSVGLVTFTYAGFMLLRPVFVRDPATAVQRAQAKEIVEKYGRSSLARAVLFDDKRYFFSQGGSVVGYALVRGTAVALGDPIGPEADLAPTIQAYTAFCRGNDWLPVYYQTLPETLAAYQKQGFEALRIGNEGIVDVTSFSIEGKEAKSIRSAVNKLMKAGYRFELYEPPVEKSLLAELKQISDEWLTTMHGSEKRFSLGWFDEAYLRDCPIGAVHSPEGWISAFANFVPEYRRNDVTIDLMRRRKEIENGTMEFLFVSMFQWAKEVGYQGFNLGLSALSGVGEKNDDPVLERVMHFVYDHINQFYNFKGLHNFKEKFHPSWSPRYLIYPSGADLLPAWLAVVQANSGSSELSYQFFRRKYSHGK